MRWICVLVVLSACASRQAPSASVVAARPIPAWVEDECAPCHDGSTPGRPDFRDLSRLGRDTILRSAMLVAQGTMPPTGSKRPEPKRWAEARELCAYAGLSDPRCADAMSQTREGKLMPSPREVRLLLEKRVPRPDSERARDRAESFDDYESVTPGTFLDPTLETKLLLWALARCPSGKALEGCLAQHIDRHALDVTPVPP